MTSVVKAMVAVVVEAAKAKADATKKIVVAVAKAAAVGAGVAALTAVANQAPAIQDVFGLDETTTGQLVAITILVRDALKSKGS
jgi:hypothetical protein